MSKNPRKNKAAFSETEFDNFSAQTKVLLEKPTYITKFERLDTGKKEALFTQLLKFGAIEQ